MRSQIAFALTILLGFATIPSSDEGGLSLAAVNRMIEGAIRGVKAREQRHSRN
jgi:hypothetical protein